MRKQGKSASCLTSCLMGTVHRAVWFWILAYLGGHFIKRWSLTPSPTPPPPPPHPLYVHEKVMHTFSICCADSVNDSAKEWEKYSTVFWFVLVFPVLIIWFWYNFSFLFVYFLVLLLFFLSFFLVLKFCFLFLRHTVDWFVLNSLIDNSVGCVNSICMSLTRSVMKEITFVFAYIQFVKICVCI